MTDYIAASNITEQEIIDYCESLVVENLLLMTVYKHSGEELITDEDLQSIYGEDYDYTVSMLGTPYMKLDVMRELALNHAAIEMTLMYNGEKYVPDDKYFNKVEIDNVITDDTETTDTTEATEEATSTEETVNTTEGTTNE